MDESHPYPYTPSLQELADLGGDQVSKHLRSHLLVPDGSWGSSYSKA